MATVKTLVSIQINFTKTKKQADRLETLAKQIETLSGSSLENSLTQIGAAWTGESAQDYVSKGRQLEEQLKKCASNLRTIAQVIRQTAQVTYNAEKQALLLAQTKSS